MFFVNREYVKDRRRTTMIYPMVRRGFNAIAPRTAFLFAGLILALLGVSFPTTRPDAPPADLRTAYNRNRPPVRDYSARSQQPFRSSPRLFRRVTLRATTVAALSPGRPPAPRTFAH